MFYTHFEGTTVNLNSDIFYITKIYHNDRGCFFRYSLDNKSIDIELGYNKNDNKQEVHDKLKNYKNNIVQYLNTKDEKYLKLNDTLFSTINLKKR